MWLVVVNKFGKTYAKEILFVLSKKIDFILWHYKTFLNHIKSVKKRTYDDVLSGTCVFKQYCTEERQLLSVIQSSFSPTDWRCRR